MPRLGFRLTERISSALLCGIITDTNSFSNSNVTAGSLRNAADLVDNGAKIFTISQQAYKLHTRAEMELWKLGMNNMHFEDNLVWSVFRKADRDAIGYIGDDDRGFVNYMGNTTGINASVLFIELNENSTKISWRAVPGFDVSRIASAFGGGGHLAASGATIRGKLDEIIPAVLTKTKAMLFQDHAATKEVSDEG
jgi:phosphoesterase RecJ-like protein